MHLLEPYLDAETLTRYALGPLASILSWYQLNEANHAAVEKRANKDAAIRKSRFHSAQSIQVLPIVPEASTLANRGLVIDSGYPSDQIVVERNFLDDDAVFRCFPSFIPGFEIDLLRHPVVKGSNPEGGYVVPFRWVAVFRRRV